MAERAGDGGGGDHGDTVLRRDGDDDLHHRLGVLGMEAPMTSEGMASEGWRRASIGGEFRAWSHQGGKGWTKEGVVHVITKNSFFCIDLILITIV